MANRAILLRQIEGRVAQWLAAAHRAPGIRGSIPAPRFHFLIALNIKPLEMVASTYGCVARFDAAFLSYRRFIQTNERTVYLLYI